MNCCQFYQLCPFLSTSLNGQCTCFLDGFYMKNAQGLGLNPQCADCDITCKACNGPTNSDCTKCHSSDTLTQGICVSPISFFINEFLLVLFFLNFL